MLTRSSPLSVIRLPGILKKVIASMGDSVEIMIPSSSVDRSQRKEVRSYSLSTDEERWRIGANERFEMPFRIDTKSN